MEQPLVEAFFKIQLAVNVKFALVQFRREMELDDQCSQEFGLTPEEIAFYDAVAGKSMTVYDSLPCGTSFTKLFKPSNAT
jgi:hypothetical protein